MKSLPLHREARRLRASSGSPARPDIQAVEISTVRMKRGDNVDESDLIEMRYQQALALTNLEALFAEGTFASEE